MGGGGGAGAGFRPPVSTRRGRGGWDVGGAWRVVHPAGGSRHRLEGGRVGGSDQTTPPTATDATPPPPARPLAARKRRGPRRKREATPDPLPGCCGGRVGGRTVGRGRARTGWQAPLTSGWGWSSPVQISCTLAKACSDLLHASSPICLLVLLLSKEDARSSGAGRSWRRLLCAVALSHGAKGEGLRGGLARWAPGAAAAAVAEALPWRVAPPPDPTW